MAPARTASDWLEEQRIQRRSASHLVSMLLLVGIIASSLTYSAFAQWMSGLVVLERAKIMLITLGVRCSMVGMFRAPHIKDTWLGGFIASYRGNSKNSFYRKIVRINRHGGEYIEKADE